MMTRTECTDRNGRQLISLRGLFRALQPAAIHLYKEVLRFSSILYIVLLLGAAIAPMSTVCYALQCIDPSHLCTRAATNSRVDDCRLRMYNIRPVMDRFVIAHLIGWAIKAAIVPNRLPLWIASASFEIVERVVAPLLPSLRECWWDSLIIDIFLCNAAGIEIGLLFAFIKNEYRRSHALLNDLSKEIVIIVAILITDLNAFLLKDALNIRDVSPLNVYRLLFFIALAPQCVRQLVKPKVFGSKMFVYIYTVALVAEFFLVICKWRT